MKYIVLSTGVYTEDKQHADQHLFVCEQKAFQDLCGGLTETCSCLGRASWTFTQVHVHVHLLGCLHS